MAGRWLFTFAGLLIWAAHFVGVYAIASLGDVITRAEDLPFRLAAMALSLGCLAATVMVTLVALRRLRKAGDAGPDFLDQLAAMGGGVAVIAILWQALPTVIGY